MATYVLDGRMYQLSDFIETVVVLPDGSEKIMPPKFNIRMADDEVKHWLLEKYSNRYIIEQLQDDKDYIRHLIARNPATPKEILLKYVDEFINDEHALLPNNSSSILLAIFEHWSYDIETLMKFYEIFAYGRGERFLRHGIRTAIVKNPLCPEALVNSLADDEFWAVRSQVARNSKTSATNLFKLARDKNITVALNAVENPNCTVDKFMEEFCEMEEFV